MSEQIQGRIVMPEEGDAVDVFADHVVVKLGPEETGGAFTVVTTTTQPGGGPPPHVHSKDDELFVVLEGRVGFWMEEGWRETGPGAVVFMPRGVAHAFKNLGDSPSKMVVVALPCGFEGFMRRCGAEFAKGGEVDMGRIVEISEEFGIRYL